MQILAGNFSISAERKKDKMLYLSLKLTGRVYLTRMGLPRWVPGFQRGMERTTRIASAALLVA